MSYIKYDLDIDGVTYSDYDKVRKNFIGDRLSKVDICAALEMCKLPMKSPKLWVLLLKYELILKHGKARNTYYVFPKELPPYSRFQGLEREFYNGSIPKKEEPKIQEKETGRIALTEEFCIDFLKKRNYVVFKVEPDFNALAQVINPEFLLQNSKAELKLTLILGKDFLSMPFLFNN